MAVGVGGLLMDIMNPQAKIGQALAGPQPNPQPQLGGAPSPTDGSGAIPANATANAPPNTPPQAPAQTYAPDPTNAQTIDKLLSLYQNEARANDLNRNIAMMGSAFGTAQQQHDKLAAIQGMPQGGAGALGAISDIQNIQKQQLANEEASRFAAGSATLLQTLGYTKDQAATIGSNPVLTQQLVEHDFANKSPTDAIKNYDQARSEMQKQGMTDTQINAIMPPQMLTLGPTADIGQRQYMQEAVANAAQGKPTPDYPTWQAQHAAAGGAMATQAKDVQEFKDTATQDYTNVNTKLTQNQKTVDQLLSNLPATMRALKYPEFLTTGKIGAMSPVDQNIKNQALALNKLRAGLTGESLSNVKNVRNVREFNTLGQAATAGLDAANSPEGLKAALLEVQNKILDAKATAEMTVGHKLTGELVGHGNRDLLDPSKPFYNGATEEAPAAGSGRPLPDATDQAIQQKLKDSPGEKGALIQHFEGLGFDMSKYK